MSTPEKDELVIKIEFILKKLQSAQESYLELQEDFDFLPDTNSATLQDLINEINKCLCLLNIEWKRRKYVFTRNIYSRHGRKST